MHRLFIVVPPEGAARMVGTHAADVCQSVLGTDNCKIFDCAAYQRAFSTMLAHSDETMVVDLVNHALAVQCFDFHPAHVLVLALAPVTLFTLNLVRKYNMKTILWFYEDFRRALYWKESLPGYDHFCAIQMSPLDDICKKHGIQFHFLPTAAMPLLPTTTPCNRAIDVGFVGIPSSYRVSVLEELCKSSISLRIAGSGWDRYRGLLEKHIFNKGWTGEKQSAEILQGCKIGLNLSVSNPANDRDPTHISPRVFDIMQNQAVLLTEDVPLLKLNIPDCRYVTFNDVTDVTSVVQSLLADYESHAEDAIYNSGIVAKNHTYRKRIELLLAMIGE